LIKIWWRTRIQSRSIFSIKYFEKHIWYISSLLLHKCKFFNDDYAM